MSSTNKRAYIIWLLALSIVTSGQEPSSPHEGAAYSKTRSSTPISDEACKQLANAYGDTDSMPYQKYRVLEVCVGQYLKAQYAKLENNLTLDEIPPLRTPNDRLNFNVKNIQINDVRIYSGLKGFIIGGVFDLSWSDSRLRWSNSIWPVRLLRLEEYSNDLAWLPEILKESSDSFPQWHSFSEINITSDGVVTARYGPYIFFEDDNCQHNVVDFPRDVFTCCTTLVSREFVGQIRYTIADGNVKIPPVPSQEEWSIKGVTAKTKNRDSGGQALEFCVSGSRTESALRIELLIPMAIAGIVCVIAPIAPSVKKQLNIKLFSLLLEFLCFEFAFYGRSYLIRSSGVPKLFRFYEFTIAVTVASLIITFLVMLFLNCKQGRIPPPRRVTGLAAIVVNVPVGLRPSEKMAGKGGMSEEPESDTSTWSTVVVAMNNLASFLLTIIYIIGIIVITN